MGGLFEDDIADSLYGRVVKDSKRHKEKFAETGPDVEWNCWYQQYVNDGSLQHRQLVAAERRMAGSQRVPTRGRYEIACLRRLLRAAPDVLTGATEMSSKVVSASKYRAPLTLRLCAMTQIALAR